MSMHHMCFVQSSLTLKTITCRHPRDELPTLYINQLQPSTLRWDALGLNITLRSSTFSDDGFATMTLLFSVGTTAESFSSGAKSVTINLKV